MAMTAVGRSEIESATAIAAGSAEEDRRLNEDVYTASAYGDMQKLCRLVETEGHSLAIPDASGFYALQWSALNNKSAIAQYILEHGGDANVVDNSGQTALHWCAVRGSIQVAELLLHNGASVEASDSHGYRPSHVAAQYGQTALLYHICSKWHAEVDSCDGDGRSPLHWAAYKGFVDPIRLLLFLSASLGRPDKEGCTPLHWAALRGNLEACTVLLQAGTKEDLLAADNTACTPAQLAADKGHRHVALFLSNARKVYEVRWEGKGRWDAVARMGLVPVLWLLHAALLLLFIRAVIASPSLPPITATLAAWSWLSVAICLGGLLIGYKATSMDPGFLPSNHSEASSVGGKEEERLLSQRSAASALQAGQWAQLCPTCRIVRPLRSKHCPICRRCVEQFDHHCPWISNCVGKKNKRAFFTFLCTQTAALLLSAMAAFLRVHGEEGAWESTSLWLRHVCVEHSGAVAYLLAALFLLTAILMLTAMQALQIARNVTTNEMANAHRYPYLRAPDGNFFNPYDRGCARNWADLCCRGQNEDMEVAWKAARPPRPWLRTLFNRTKRPPGSDGDVAMASSPAGKGDDVERGTGRSGHVHGAGCDHSHKTPGLGRGLHTH